jgi:ribonuclease HI
MGEFFKFVLQMHFPASNNVPEYEALLHGAQIAMTLSIQWLKVLGDLLLVINQANKEWSCLDEKMMMYYKELCKLENNFDGLEYHHILHGWNEVVDELAKLSSSQAMVPLGVFRQELRGPSINRALSKASKVVESIKGSTPPNDNKPESFDAMTIHLDWLTPFMIYLKIGGLPKDKDERERLWWWVGVPDRDAKTWLGKSASL